MMRNIAVISCVLWSGLQLAAAEPSKDDLDERAKLLEKKLAGQHFVVMVQPPFVVVADDSAGSVKRQTNFLHWTTELIEKDFFAKRPDKLLEVWLFKNEKTYRSGAKKFFDDEPTTPYGYYSPAANALIMNMGPGAGTLSHELVHPYMEKNFPDGPSWFNEGLASLYETPREKAGHIVGAINWRLPNLKAEIRAGTLPALAKLMSTTREGFYEAPFDAYAYARYLLMYLQEQGKLREFFTKFVADTKDLTGQTALAVVVGEDLATFEPKWRKWVLALKR
ncbi:MAG: glycogen branching enzyme [Myxococcales bacterium]|nr:glycogen branching enzyme [Myxococcales bacterium]